MQHASKFDLSICIPTYNRITKLESLVRKILTCDDGGIEVVVLDNASTDRTLECLKSISDERLTVYRNETNKGVLFNVLHALDRAQGRFAVLLLDKDNVEPQLLPGFRRFLVSQPELACGYCEYGSALSAEAVLFDAGMAALKGVAYACHHPTGYFFEMATLRVTNYLHRFSDFDVVGHFPLDFVFAELVLRGRGAIYHRPVFAAESEASAKSYKSIGTNAAREDAFFSPRGRLKTAIGFARHIATLPLLPAEKLSMIADCYRKGVVASTIGYRAVMGNEALCAHYHIAARRVSAREMFATAREFRRTFSAQALSPVALGAVPFRRARFGLAVCLGLLKAFGRRFS
jgi:hypothetical protein